MAVPKSVGRWGGAACGSVKVRCLAARRAQGLLQSYFFFFFVFFWQGFIRDPAAAGESKDKY